MQKLTKFYLVGAVGAGVLLGAVAKDALVPQSSAQGAAHTSEVGRYQVVTVDQDSGTMRVPDKILMVDTVTGRCWVGGEGWREASPDTTGPARYAPTK